MSGAFDDNPFAPPPQPAQEATPSAGFTETKTDNDDPFGANNATVPIGAPPGSKAGEEPATMRVDSFNNTAQPPPYTASGQQQVTAADFEELQRRQEELERRAKELERREQELRNAPYNARANNWPPLPSFCPMGPCFYQDINVDIPVEFQKIVNHLYYMWVAHVSLLFANMIVGLLFMFVGGDWGGTFMLAAFYFIIFSPASFVCWFRPAYKAFRDDSSVQFMVFFFVFFFQFLMSIISALGIGETGSCGFILGLKKITGSDSTGGIIFVGVLMLITSIGFALCALADFYLLTRVHKLYKASGASFAKAQSEFTSGVMKNETVQRAAADAASASARGAFTAATTNANSGGDNR